MKIKSVTNCARCGKNHKELEAHEFTIPPTNTLFTHWIMCPELNEPILMYMLETKAKDVKDESVG